MLFPCQSLLYEYTQIWHLLRMRYLNVIQCDRRAWAMSECECHMCRFGFIRFDAPVAQPHRYLIPALLQHVLKVWRSSRHLWTENYENDCNVQWDKTSRVTEQKDILARWAEHFNNDLNPTTHTSEIHKYGGNHIKNRLIDLLLKIWAHESFPW